MTAANLTLEIEQGATYQKTLTWKSGKPAKPVDLTGCTARMSIREVIGTPLALVRLTTEDGGIQLGGEEGLVMITASATKTALLIKRANVYALKIIFPDGTVRRLLSGAVSVSLDADHD